ncbi:hypothetical protein MBLNU459_g6073t1 [Dothideomycetes sp. NU459]
MDSSDDESRGVFAIGEDLVPSREHKAAGSSVIDFDGLLKTPLKMHEDLAEGCGGMLWPAGMVLSKYMLRQDASGLKQKSILAVALGFEPVQPLHITDQIPMFALMERNIALNGLGGRVEASVYDWGSPVPAAVPRHPDIILAADCVYFEPAFPLLQQTLQDLIGPNTVCYFCFKKRRRADMHFVKAIKKMFDIEDVQDDPEKPVWSRENLFLYKLTLKDSHS